MAAAIRKDGAHGDLRAACLLHAAYRGDTLRGSRALARELLAMCDDGRRPRYGHEIGLRLEDFA